MNILIINQPLKNRGDESAHKGLIRSLIKTLPAAHVTVAFIGTPQADIDTIKVIAPSVEYVNYNLSRGRQKISHIALKYNLTKLATTVVPAYFMMEKLINKADYVICAPGGICMGLFQSWEHLFWMYRAMKLNKKLAYYSRSFGPFSTQDNNAECFFNISRKILNYFQFISIRDNKTMQIADSLGISYTPSIDTAFLEQPNVSLPSCITTNIGDNYVVFVPNTLVWHSAYKGRSTQEIKEFYLHIIDSLSAKFPNSKIVMMPQLYNRGDDGDYQYFKVIKEAAKNDNIITLDDTYNSDIQQTIISKSKFVVGARYHSIVFAINNNIPFVSLSYEHKMNGLLSILDMDKYQVDIANIATNELPVKTLSLKFDQVFSEIINIKTDHSYSKDANLIANNCFDNMISNFINSND